LTPIPDYTEDDLVKLLKAKDKTAFKFLYEKYSGALYANILQIMPDKSMAGDLLQDIFLTIWRKFDGYDNTKGRLFTWMLTITRNTCIDKIRSRQYKSQLKNVYISEENEDELYASGATVIMPDTMNYIGLKKAVQKLKPQHRNLIDMAYYRGYTQSEIAGIEGVPMGTIKTRIRKALLELRQQLQ